MARKASECIERKSYVSKRTRNSTEREDVFASDEVAEGIPSRKKVRKELSVLELKKDSECFKVDGDHIYSNSRNEEQVRIFKNGNSDKLPRIYLKRAAAFKRSQSDNSGPNCNDEISNCILSSKRQKCSSKNAVMARLNRERKKQYISSLESTKDRLLMQNDEIREKVNKQEKIIADLQSEVRYLKSMLANSKEISDILRSLKTSTGLPVTSSLMSLTSAENDINDSNTSQLNEGMQSKTCTEIRQPCIKRVTSGTNFPILQNDVNLGYVSEDGDEVISQKQEEMDFSLSADSDLSLDGVFLNEYDFDFNYSMFDNLFDAEFSLELENHNKKDEVNVNNTFKDVNKYESDVGLCLHINKRKISVELCSLCNTRAQIK